MKPGDTLTGESGKRWKLGELVAIQGDAECTSRMCRRMGSDYTKNPPDIGRCVGYHCPKCGEPCSMMGHGCQDTAA